ncbi:sensor histidine kinase [Streptodolium elevatio]|uniref:histidine kinase n=1 Tax=Streptodolium elevatio TaxID=3157996 RepID=A0ABV3DCY7_9ACTN
MGHTVAMRAKLAISSIVVLAMGLVVLISFSVMGIRHYLTSSIDDDLRMSRDGIEQTGMSTATITQLVGSTDLLRQGMLSAGLHGNVFVILDPTGAIVPLGGHAADPAQTALAATSRVGPGETLRRAPHAVSLGGEDYRAAAARLPDGNVIVLAQPSGDVEDVVLKVVHLELVVGGVLVVLLGTFIYFGARWRLRPLEDMVETASAIAEGDPDRPNLSRRVAPRKKTFREVEQLRTALNAMLEQVETAFDTREHAAVHLKRFVADASHELRTPLAAIRGYLQLYEKGMLADEEERTRALTRMSAETERMARLVDELLALARLDQRPQLRPRPVDLVCVVREAADDLRAQQSERCVRVDAPDACAVLADESLVRQIVGNLLTNVRVHTPVSADVRLSVATVTTARGERAILRVRDEGPGMRAEDAERIFDRFFRATHEGAAGTTGVPPGSGLGMAVVQAAVAAHGGSVRVTTALGRGLTVVVELPATGAEGLAGGGAGKTRAAVSGLADPIAPAAATASAATPGSAASHSAEAP